MSLTRRLTAVAALVVGVSLAAGVVPAAQAAVSEAYRLVTVMQQGGEGQPIHWSPCARPITFQVNVDALRGKREKRRAIRESRWAFSRAAEASGYDFRFAGRTHRVPRTDNLASQRADVVVAFVHPRQTDYPLGGSTAGYGGTRWVSSSETGHRSVITQGFVVIDHPQSAGWNRSLKRGGVTRPNLIAHEVGHALGLDHVDDQRQIMYPVLGEGAPRGFAAGDRAGLRKLHRIADCAA